MTEEEIWKNEIHTKNRNVIKKGIKNGLEFVLDDGYKYIYDFIRLYNSTMDRLSQMISTILMESIMKSLSRSYQIVS